MDLKQLEAFVYVAKLNSFSKAADTIYLSQPTISSHINALEKELGTQLLIRSTKEVYPTKSGLDFFVYAQNMLALRDEAIHSVAQGGSSIRGEISLLASSVPAQYLLPSLIAVFQKSYPDILFKVRQSDSEQVGKMLSNCIYDFGIQVQDSLETSLFRYHFIMIRWYLQFLPVIQLHRICHRKC